MKGNPMADCVCCNNKHRALAVGPFDRWCRQCQKDGCPIPTMEAMMSPREFTRKWAPKDKKRRYEFCLDLGSVCGRIAARHEATKPKR